MGFRNYSVFVTAILLTFLAIFTIFPQAVYASVLVPVHSPHPLLKQVDPRSIALQAYLIMQGSPLQNYTDEMIEVSDKYGLDWKLLPSIAAVESKFGKVIPYGKDDLPSSYNAWGWGIHSGHSIYFTSWQNAIQTVAVGLKTQFYEYGLTNPDSMNYKYSVNPAWADEVNYYMWSLDNFQKDYLSKNIDVINAYNNKVAEINYQSQLLFSIAN